MCYCIELTSMGCLDVACAGIAYKKAISMGIGEEYQFDK